MALSTFTALIDFSSLHPPPHPKKKRFAGAEAAFELVKEAHKVLSNHAQRSLYDSKLQTIIQTAKLTIQNNFSNHSTAQNQVMSQPHEQTQICPTFWTTCPFCTNARYQYPKNLINRPTCCQKCFKVSIAYELIDRGGLLKAASRYVLNQSTHLEHKNIPCQGA
ncbi:DnaJ subfamily B member 12 [Cinnamomum micranthum f. kanehirae]|uniref:DnaJ subfamily B member 12 n=1 Tax=Cinnamomum micranthum f. kanehirae TaxID=337451 RepID=A0A3S3MMX8_9MAGN|nr:DnaJ subfamily B member 12 [Cinnamomum micranthum f. kanehirae]